MRTVRRFAARLLIFSCLLVVGQTAHAGEKITIAAAADLKFALDEIVVLFNKAHAKQSLLGASANVLVRRVVWCVHWY